MFTTLFRLFLAHSLLTRVRLVLKVYVIWSCIDVFTPELAFSACPAVTTEHNGWPAATAKRLSHSALPHSTKPAFAWSSLALCCLHLPGTSRSPPPTTLRCSQRPYHAERAWQANIRYPLTISDGEHRARRLPPHCAAPRDLTTRNVLGKLTSGFYLDTVGPPKTLKGLPRYLLTISDGEHRARRLPPHCAAPRDLTTRNVLGKLTSGFYLDTVGPP
ncbi:hypothetical protein J6590_005167 [Homalodisca vitripennis]|nr:hypothetical protein J6590_005167 [Homalodisca vitripennis]